VSGVTLSSSRWALTPSHEAATALHPPEGTFESRLTLAELGLSLDDTGAAMEEDPKMGALTMQSLGLNLDDLEEPRVLDEDIAERLGRIMKTFGHVGTSADLVLFPNAMEPDSSIFQEPPFIDLLRATGSAPPVQYTQPHLSPSTSMSARAAPYLSDRASPHFSAPQYSHNAAAELAGEEGRLAVLSLQTARSNAATVLATKRESDLREAGAPLRPRPRESGLETHKAQRTPRQQVEEQVLPDTRGVMATDSRDSLQKEDINLGDLGLDLRDLSAAVARDSPQDIDDQAPDHQDDLGLEQDISDRALYLALDDVAVDISDRALYLALDDFAVGAHNFDDSVLVLAQQFAKENDV